MCACTNAQTNNHIHSNKHTGLIEWIQWTNNEDLGQDILQSGTILRQRQNIFGSVTSHDNNEVVKATFRWTRLRFSQDLSLQVTFCDHDAVLRDLTMIYHNISYITNVRWDLRSVIYSSFLLILSASCTPRHPNSNIWHFIRKQVWNKRTNYLQHMIKTCFFLDRCWLWGRGDNLCIVHFVDQ